MNISEQKERDEADMIFDRLIKLDDVHFEMDRNGVYSLLGHRKGETTLSEKIAEILNAIGSGTVETAANSPNNHMLTQARLSGNTLTRRFSIHRDYGDLGADIITTNTFGTNSIEPDEWGVGSRVEELNSITVRITKAEGG